MWNLPAKLLVMSSLTNKDYNILFHYNHCKIYNEKFCEAASFKNKWEENKINKLKEFVQDLKQSSDMWNTVTKEMLLSIKHKLDNMDIISIFVIENVNIKLQENFNTGPWINEIYVNNGD